MFKGSFLKARGSASKSTSLSPGSRSSAKSEAEHSPQPALRGLVMKMMWPIACWAACCFFATAVVYTCADIWKWKMLEFKSETAYAGVSVVFSLVLYGIVESIGQNYKLRYLGRYDKFTILMTKMLIDFVVHMGLIGNLTKFPSSNNGMWHDIALSWGSGIICVTSTILGRLTIEVLGRFLALGECPWSFEEHCKGLEMFFEVYWCPTTWSYDIHVVVVLMMSQSGRIVGPGLSLRHALRLAHVVGVVILVVGLW